MLKSVFWTGVALAAAGLTGVVVSVLYVLPVTTDVEPLPTSPTQAAQLAFAKVVVLAAALGLAVGSALIGIGIGHWKHPRPMSDGSQEI
jgi:hypothetical protein